MIDAAVTAWPEVAASLQSPSGLAFLPFGALEQHGHHLPLSTDTLVADHVARALAEHFDAVLLPALNYGDTWNNASYPATFSLSAATVTAIASDLARAVTECGGRGLVIVNGDWGNRAPLAAVNAPILVLNYPGMDDAAARVRDSAQPAPGMSLDHAGEIETSILLELAADLVLQDRYTACYPDFPADFGVRPMQLHPFSASGVFGDPGPASAAKGRAILAATVAASIDEVTAYLTTRATSTTSAVVNVAPVDAVQDLR